ncbi:hypothetical protein PFISCL1PPCAC_21364, partial [Pristionchus fissidentatus]
VLSIDRTVTRSDLIQFLQRVGPLTAISFPVYHPRKPLPNELLGGKPVLLRRADFWFKNDPYR